MHCVHSYNETFRQLFLFGWFFVVFGLVFNFCVFCLFVCLFLMEVLTWKEPHDILLCEEGLCFRPVLA